MAVVEVLTQAEADAIPSPKHVWHDMTVFRVYTGDDIPASVAQSRIIEAYEFRNRFTVQQQLAVMQSALDDKDLVLRLTLMDLWTATQGVDLDGDKVRQGLAHCVQVGILTQSDADAITA